MIYVTNAFSINMLSGPCTVQFTPVRRAVAQEFLVDGYQGAIGHQDTAALVETDLGVSGLFNRTTLQVGPGDTVLVAQYRGPRLPEGATTLPEGAVIEYWIASIQ